MKLTMERLRKIIAEEYARAERLQESRRIQRVHLLVCVYYRPALEIMKGL
jgi:hypothetical protein